jgi:hypothetical protein
VRPTARTPKFRDKSQIARPCPSPRDTARWAASVLGYRLALVSATTLVRGKVGWLTGDLAQKSRTTSSDRAVTSNNGAPSGTRTPNPLSLIARLALLSVSTRNGALTCAYAVCLRRVVTRCCAPVLVQSRMVKRRPRQVDGACAAPRTERRGTASSAAPGRGTRARSHSRVSSPTKGAYSAAQLTRT